MTNIALLITFVIALLCTLLNPSWMKFGFTHISYYIILALVLTWGYSLVMLWKEKGNTSAFLRSHWKGLVFTLIVASLIFTSTSKCFRVLSDEANLLSVAKSMTFEKSTANVTEGKWYYGNFWSSQSSLEKRPFLFPFFTSITHTLLGYRPENVFLLNYFVLWAVLFLLYLIIRSSLNTIWAFAAIVLVVAQPIISLSATSGSFELFNFLFICAGFLSLRYFLADPGYRSCAVLFLNLTMLANIRYESALFFVIIAAVLLATRSIRLHFFARSATFALIPLFCLPLIWQRIIAVKIPDSNLTGGSWVNAFSFENLRQNITLFFKYVFDINGHLGYAGLVNYAGALAIIYFAFLFIKNKGWLAPRNHFILTISSVSSLVALFFLVLLYQGSIAEHPMNGRLYIPLLVTLSVLPVYFLAHLVKNAVRASRLFFAAALALFIFYHPVAIEDRLSNQLLIVRDFRYLLDFLKTNVDHNSLVICGRPGQLIIYNYGAISFSTANTDKATVMEQFQNNLFNKIYVVQEILYATKLPDPSNAVDPDYHLQMVEELQGSTTYFLRISKVIR